MTANQLIKELQRQTNKLTTGDVEVLLDGNPFFVGSLLEESNGNYFINLVSIV